MDRLVENMDQQRIDGIDTHALQRLLVRTHKTVIAVVEPDLEIQAADPVIAQAAPVPREQCRSSEFRVSRQHRAWLARLPHRLCVKPPPRWAVPNPKAGNLTAVLPTRRRLVSKLLTSKYPRLPLK